jgi:hypothetical protein
LSLHSINYKNELRKEMKDLYTENYKTRMKEIEDKKMEI